MRERPQLTDQGPICFLPLGEPLHPAIHGSNFLFQPCALGCLNHKSGLQGSLPLQTLSQQYHQDDQQDSTSDH